MCVKSDVTPSPLVVFVLARVSRTMGTISFVVLASSLAVVVVVLAP